MRKRKRETSDSKNKKLKPTIEQNETYKLPEQSKKEPTQTTDVDTPTYTEIEENIYYRKTKKLKKEDIQVCSCSKRKGKRGCGHKCINRILNIECTPSFCPTGSMCANQRFQKKIYPKLKVVKTPKKGFGVFADENLRKGQNYKKEIQPHHLLPSPENHSQQIKQKSNFDVGMKRSKRTEHNVLD